LINGGLKNNIIPDNCEINLNLRAIPKHTGTKIPRYWLNEIIKRLKEKDPEFNATILSAYTRPALDIPETSEIVKTLKEIIGTEIIGVPYYTEAITYTEKGIPTVVCGPGNIEQAHKPNEYISLNQLKKAVKSFELLIKKTCFNVD
jgi:acetylornithine deacetylase